MKLQISDTKNGDKKITSVQEIEELVDIWVEPIVMEIYNTGGWDLERIAEITTPHLTKQFDRTGELYLSQLKQQIRQVLREGEEKRAMF